MNRIKLIAFDLDGVLVDGRGSWREVHQGLDTEEQSRVHEREFYDEKITFDEWALKDARLWNGVEIQRIIDILYSVPLMNGINQTIPRLKECYKLAIISGGLQILVDRVKNRYGFDYAIGNELLTNDSKVSGIKQVISFDGKGEALRKIAVKEHISPAECAVIGDYANDIPMFKVAGFSIAFNPKDKNVVESADRAIYKKDLREILQFF